MEIAIAGFGNLGKAAAKAVQAKKECSLVGVFSRRNIKTLSAPNGTPLYPFDTVEKFKGKIDVILNCTGSARDLPKTTPLLAKSFNVVDSFDTHAKIPEHIKKVDSAAKAAKTTAVVSVGWDPGLFSLARLYMKSVLQNAQVHTFWGKGVSQGHTDALREIDGVLFAREYTVPNEGAVESVRAGNASGLCEKQLHRRVCYVVAKDNADTALIKEKIKTMPEYFAGYETTVNFISLDDFLLEHKSMAHAGTVIGLGDSEGGLERLEFSLSTASNPELTAKILLACAKACFEMNKRREYGCKSVFDIKARDIFPFGTENLLSIL